MPNIAGVIKAPINQIADVKTVLNEKTNNLTELCKSDNINPWSLYKPLNSSKLSKLTEDEKKALNYGYNVTANVYNNPRTAWSAIEAGTTWIYIKPTTACRLSDFEGYDHYAKSPFADVELNQTSAEIGNTISISVGNIQSVLQFGEFSNINKSGNLQLGVLMSSGRYYPLTGLNRPDLTTILSQDRVAFTVDNSFTNGQSYECVLVFTTWNNNVPLNTWTTIGADDYTGTWYPLPMQRMRFTVKKPTDVKDLIKYSTTATFTRVNETTFRNITINITVSGSGTFNAGTLLVEFTVDRVLSGSTSTTVSLGSRQFTNFSSSSTQTGSVTYSGTIELVASKDDDGLPVTITLSFTENNGTSHGSWSSTARYY